MPTPPGKRPPTDARIEAAVERQRQEANQKLRARLWILGTIGATAPFIGLFGTVVGIMRAFHQMGITGQGGFSVVAAGISEALITTAGGIAVAIEAVILYNMLNVLAGRLQLQLEAPHRGVPGDREGSPGRSGRSSRSPDMSMSNPEDDGGTGSGAGIFADINITPLTDIFLVLLIIFMVTTTAIAEAGGQNGGIKVSLPKGGPGQRREGGPRPRHRRPLGRPCGRAGPGGRPGRR